MLCTESREACSERGSDLVEPAIWLLDVQTFPLLRLLPRSYFALCLMGLSARKKDEVEARAEVPGNRNCSLGMGSRVKNAFFVS